MSSVSETVREKLRVEQERADAAAADLQAEYQEWMKRMKDRFRDAEIKEVEDELLVIERRLALEKKFVTTEKVIEMAFRNRRKSCAF